MKKHFWKKQLVFILGLTMAVAIAGCGKNSDVSKAPTETADEPVTAENENGEGEKAKEGGKKIGMCAMSLGFDFQIQMSNGIQRAADESGYEYMVYDYNSDAENMLSGLETLAVSDVGAMYGLFMAPESATAFMQSNPDIGVLTQGEIVEGARACTENDYVALAEQFIEALDKYVAANNITQGDIAALWLTTCENEDSSYYDAKEDIKAVIEKWCEGKEFQFVSEFFPVDDEEASNMTTQIINATPNVKFFFCFNNGYAIAAANEIASAVPDASEYFVFSSEGDAESFRLIADESSPYRSCAYMNIEESGYAVGKQLIRWVESGEMENVIVKKELIDIDNVMDYLQ